MNFPLPWSSSPEAAPTTRHILYDFDGPKMVLGTDEGGRQVLGIAIDEDEGGIIRWSYAPIAPEKVLRLLAGEPLLHALYADEIVSIFDLTDHGQTVRSCTVLGHDLPDDFLPEADAMLPSLTDEARASIEEEQLRLIGERDR